MKGGASLIRDSPEYSGYPCKEHFVSQPTLRSDFTQLSTYVYLQSKPDLGRRLQQVRLRDSRGSRDSVDLEGFEEWDLEDE